VKLNLNYAFRRGFEAAKTNWLPAVVLQGVMAILVLGYFVRPDKAWLLLTLSRWQQEGGLLFCFVATGFSGGVLAELCKVYLLQSGRWTPMNFENAGFRFILFGVHGVVVYHLMLSLAYCFGSVPTLGVVTAKVFMDEVVFTALWAIPYYTLGYAWQRNRYSWSRTFATLKNNYFGEIYIPAMISSLCFWIPVAILVYVMPRLLQMPVFILATALWSLLLVTLSRQEEKISTTDAASLTLPVIRLNS
jgi:hypothetical protein